MDLVYLDSLSWAVATMTGTSYGDVSPTTNYEIFISIIMMILGASFYGKVFADFEKIMQVMRKERMDKK